MASIDSFSESIEFNVSPEKIADLGDLLYVTDEDRERYESAARRIEDMYFDEDMKSFFHISGDLFVKGAVLPEATSRTKLEDKKALFTSFLVDYALFSPNDFRDTFINKILEKIKDNSDIAKLDNFLISSIEKNPYEVSYVQTLLDENTSYSNLVDLFDKYMISSSEDFEKCELERFCKAVVSIICAINDTVGVKYLSVTPEGFMEEVRGPFDIEVLEYFTGGNLKTPNPAELQEEVRKIAVESLPTDPNEITENDIITAEYTRDETAKMQVSKIALQRLKDFEEVTLEEFRKIYFCLPMDVREKEDNNYMDYMHKISYFKNKIQSFIDDGGDEAEYGIYMNKFENLVCQVRDSLERYRSLNNGEARFFDYTSYVKRNGESIDEFGPTLDDAGNIQITANEGNVILVPGDFDEPYPEYIKLSLRLDQGNEGNNNNVETDNFKTSTNFGVKTDDVDGLIEAESLIEPGQMYDRSGTLIEKPLVIQKKEK